MSRLVMNIFLPLFALFLSLDVSQLGRGRGCGGVRRVRIDCLETVEERTGGNYSLNVMDA